MVVRALWFIPPLLELIVMIIKKVIVRIVIIGTIEPLKKEVPAVGNNDYTTKEES